jgi:hypothetical protein
MKTGLKTGAISGNGDAKIIRFTIMVRKIDFQLALAELCKSAIQ